jgi:hypothetical protein
MPGVTDDVPQWSPPVSDGTTSLDNQLLTHQYDMPQWSLSASGGITQIPCKSCWMRICHNGACHRLTR